LALVPTTTPGQGAGTAKDDRARAGGVYRRPVGNEPATLDPARVSDIYSRSVTEQIFDGLVQFDRNLMIAPALATYWKASRDGLTWTFTVRRGVSFHHGREVTADDVAYSLTRLLDPRTKSGAADLFSAIKGAREFREGKRASVSGITVLGRYSLEISLTEAFTPFVSLLAVGHAKIVPRDVAEREGDRFGTRPVGTGPFKFARWERGREIVLAAHADYFGGAPRLSELRYRIFPGEPVDSIYREFEAGRLEDSPVLGGARPPQRYQHIRRPMFSVRFYGFNTRTKPLNDRRVREAITAAIDRDSIRETIFLGRYHPARGILPPGTPGFNPEIRDVPYAPERARALLRDAGYGLGRKFPALTLWSSVKSERLSQEHQAIKVALAAVGVPLEVRYETDWPTFSRLLGEGRLPIFLYAWFADVPDPDNFLAKLFFSRSPRNFTRYDNAVVDQLLAQARREGDLPRRVELYRHAERLILADVPIIPMWHYTYERLFQPYVRSIEVNGLGDPYIPLRKIWLETPP
jgi:peptide/nickel transport system substrate-binding protein/oligopeptide transport system substrate-binding protein